LTILAKYLLLKFWKESNGTVKVGIQSDSSPTIMSRDGRTWELLGRTGNGAIKLITYDCCPSKQHQNNYLFGCSVLSIQ